MLLLPAIQMSQAPTVEDEEEEAICMWCARTSLCVCVREWACVRSLPHTTSHDFVQYLNFQDAGRAVALLEGGCASPLNAPAEKLSPGASKIRKNQAPELTRLATTVLSFQFANTPAYMHGCSNLFFSSRAVLTQQAAAWTMLTSGFTGSLQSPVCQLASVCMCGMAATI